MEDNKNAGQGASCSGAPDQIEENSPITKAMEDEEKEIETENAIEEGVIKKKHEEELKAEAEASDKDRVNTRLMQLLSMSQAFADYLKKNIVSSKLKENECTISSQETTENANESRSLKEINAASDSVSPQTSPTRRSSRKRTRTIDNIDDKTIDNTKKRRLEPKDILMKPAEPLEETGFRINSRGLKVPKEQPKLFEGAVLRSYQIQGLQWLWALFENGVSGILADEMGLGKTAQVIAFLCYLIELKFLGPFLIVAPLSTLPNWMMEFERFAPKIPVVLFHGPKNERSKLHEKIRTEVKINEELSIAPIVLTSFQVPLQEEKFMSSMKWWYVVVDEGHALKNSNTQLSRCLRRLSSVNRLLITGTPLQNNLKELWSLLNFLMPDLFEKKEMFESLFDTDSCSNSEFSQAIIQKETESNFLTMLHQILTPFLLRRLKTDVDLCLPPKKEVMVFCPLTNRQRELYNATLNGEVEALVGFKMHNENLAIDLNSPRQKRKCAESKKDYTFKNIDWFGDRKPQAGDETPKVEVKDDTPTTHIKLRMACPEMQLRKIANHPYLIEMPIEVVNGEKIMASSEEIINQSGKMLALSAMLQKLHQGGHKVLIFSYFKEMLDLIEEFAHIRDYGYVRLDGDDDIAKRKANIYEFNSQPAIFLFLITTRAGGLGINLTSADTVILFDNDYNPQVDLQAIDRCHRIGQTKPVMVYRFVSSGTVDEKIVNMASGKRKLEKVIIKKGLFKSATPSKKVLNDIEELKKLLESTDHCRTMQANGLIFTEKELEELLDRDCDNIQDAKSHLKVMTTSPVEEDCDFK